MTNFSVGDKIRGITSHRECTVLAIGDNTYYVKFDNGHETCVAKDGAYEIVPKENVRYINLYKNGLSSSHFSRNSADSFQDDGRIACQRIVLTEGVFDE